jgi:hypothetical protein
MTVPNSAGRFFKIEGSKLELFGFVYGFLTNSKDWAIYHPSISLFSWPNEYPPTPISPKISKIIQNDTKAGNESKIAYVGVEPIVAIKLWLEGIINQSHFTNFVEVGETTDAEDKVYIELHEVILDGKPRTVRIYAFPGYSYGTFDASGNTV